MQRLNVQSILFNATGAFIVLTVIGYMAIHELSANRAAQCSARFQNGQQIALVNDKDQPLSPIELQARAGSREWGVLNNTKVVTAAGAPLGTALEVSLVSTGNEDNADQNGLGFAWLVSKLNTAQSACLSYSVFIAPNFRFAEPGYLPGLFAGSDLSVLDQSPPSGGAVARMGWVDGGAVGVEVRTPTTTGYWLGAGKTRWPTGRWVAIQQEVKLNTPGQSDGLIRVWVDGELKVESSGLDLRGKDPFALAGVVGDIGYARTISEPGSIQVSPFVVQWP